MSHFAPEITFGENALLNQMMWKCEQRYTIIFDYMQRFCCLISQSNWCRNASKLIYQKGESSFLWDTQNVVYNQFDLTHWGQDKMDAISQTTFSSAFSWFKMFEFRLKFHWSLFVRVQLTIINLIVNQDGGNIAENNSRIIEAFNIFSWQCPVW